VDLGSGGGFDCFLAAREVGARGRVIGVDITPEMISRARMNKEKTGFENVEFRLGEIEHLPIEDNLADLIVSNCVINLSPEKKQVYQDAFRVLKPGGRLAVSDIVALKPLPEHIQKDLALVSACIGGAATIEETQRMLKEAGFEDIIITPKRIGQELINEYLPGSPAGEYVASASIQAQKPIKNI
jgi:SAM-dependent methyltransferase